MMESPSLQFGVACGRVTKEEEEYLLAKGLKFENSRGELLEVSTDVEDASFSSLLSVSEQESLMLFEDNERLFGQNDSKNEDVRNTGSANPRKSMSLNGSLNKSCLEAVEELNDENDEEDKENVFYGEHLQAFQNASFDDGGTTGTDKILISDSIDLGDTSCEKVRLSGSVLVPCTQSDSIHERSLNGSYQPDDTGVDVVPCTQYPAEENCDASMDENVEIVPATQPNQAFETEDSQFDTSSVPCSQQSVGLSGTSNSKSDLDDTLTIMTRLLELADEQEANEKAKADEDAKNIKEADNLDTSVENASDSNIGGCENADESDLVAEDGDQTESQKEPEIVFKTPLKHVRVQNLKGKKLCTPSPPRSYVDTLLQKGVIRKTEVINKPVINSPKQMGSPRTTKGARTPLANITPMKTKQVPNASSTPRNLKTPVSAKVDSGLRGRTSPFTIGLSPVANYIYSKPAPSTFAKVQGIQKTTTSKIPTNSSFSRNSSINASRIPSRISQAQANSITPKSAAKEPRRHGPLRTSTYFDTTCTPPKIVANEVVEPMKRFQPLQYTGSTKVKAVNSKVNSPVLPDFVAHRHTGLRDESGNASFIQNTSIQKKNIPQSRLVTPKATNRAYWT